MKDDLVNTQPILRPIKTTNNHSTLRSLVAMLALFALALAGAVLPPGARAEHPPTAFMFTDRVANTSLRMPQAGPASVTDFPQTLADTGAFADLATLTPQPGIIPFELNVPLWSDGAHKTRWFCLPGANRIVFSRDGGWVASIGTRRCLGPSPRSGHG